jgi:hypothetical protein
MFQVLATMSRAAFRFGAIVVLGAALLTGVLAEAAADTGCGDNAVMSSCCGGDDADHCADPASAPCAARCLCGVAHPFGIAATMPSPRAMAHAVIAVDARAAPPDHRAPPLTPPPIVRL